MQQEPDNRFKGKSLILHNTCMQGFTLLNYGSFPFTSVVGSEIRPLQKNVRKVVGEKK